MTQSNILDVFTYTISRAKILLSHAPPFILRHEYEIIEFKPPIDITDIILQLLIEFEVIIYACYLMDIFSFFSIVLFTKNLIAKAAKLKSSSC